MKWGVFFNHLLGAIFYIIFLTYFGTSLASIIMQSATLGAGGIILNILVLLFEILGPIYATYLMVQLFDGIMERGKVEYDVAKIKTFPKVAVIIPTHNVSEAMLRETLEGCKKLTYPNCEFWLGDDCSVEEYAAVSERLAKEYSFNFLKGEKRAFKAGLINKILPKVEANYVTIIDADQIPAPDILEKFVAILEQYPEYTFVQGKYKTRNISNLLHVWEALSSFQLFCSQGGRRKLKTVIFHGTSACFRKEYLYPLPENQLSEDYEHTLRIASKGHYGYFLNEVATYGLVLESIDHKMSQMYRWTTGQVSSFRNNFFKFFRSKLKLRQFIDYFITSTFVLLLTAFYFMGIFYTLMYAFRIDIVRGLELFSAGGEFNDIVMVIMPLMVGVVYIFAFSAVGIYSKKTTAFKMKAWHIVFFTIYGGLMAPFLLLPTFKGFLGRNRIDPEKTQWNKKIRLVLIASIYTLLGLAFAALGIISLLDAINIIPYYGNNYFYPLFFTMAITLIMALPFVLLSRKLFKTEKYYKEEKTRYF